MRTTAAVLEKPAIIGGPKAVTLPQEEALRWPIITEEEVHLVNKVLRSGELSLSGARTGYADDIDPRLLPPDKAVPPPEITPRLEWEFARYIGVRHALSLVNGTAALHAALYAVGVREADEVIAPAYTYWATIVPALWCGATPVLAEVDSSLNLAPADFERKITRKTKAVVVVHLWGLPADMESILAIARRHRIAVIEDASHAHGASYRGRRIGSLGEVGAFSLQTSKLLPAGEGGILVTEQQEYYERAALLGHYERVPELSEKFHLGRTSLGFKYRLGILSAAVALAQLSRLEEQNRKRRENILRLCEALEDLGFDTFREPPGSERVWYEFIARYRPERFARLSLERLVEALTAEGAIVRHCRYQPLYALPFFQEERCFRELFPFTSLSFRTHRVEDFPATEKVTQNLLSLPTFPAADFELVDQYSKAFRKVAEYARQSCGA